MCNRWRQTQESWNAQWDYITDSFVIHLANDNNVTLSDDDISCDEDECSEMADLVTEDQVQRIIRGKKCESNCVLI